MKKTWCFTFHAGSRKKLSGREQQRLQQRQTRLACSPMRYLFLLASVYSSPLFLVPRRAASLSARSTPVSAPGRMAIIGWGRSARDWVPVRRMR